MSLADVVSGMTGTHEEVYQAVRALQVSVPGLATGAQLQQLMIPARLVTLIKDRAAAVDDTSIMRDICDAVKDRLVHNSGIDFGDAQNQGLFSQFLADPEVQARISASTTYGTVQAFQAAVIDAASTMQPQFPDVTLRQVIEVRDPALAATETSNAVAIKGISQVLKLTTAAAMPETTRLSAQISHDGIVWQPLQTSGLESVSGAGLYVFRVLPGPVFITESQVRVVSPYSVGLVLA